MLRLVGEGQRLALLERNDLALREGARVLDFGCASGRLTRWFADYAESGEVWGVDVSGGKKPVSALENSR